MTLDDLIADLLYGEMSQHPYAQKDTLTAKQKGTLIHYINAALTTLHSEFPLLQEEVIIQQYDDISEYVLDSKYAQSHPESSEMPKYILDSTSKPFQDNVLRIDDAYDEAGCRIAINDAHDPESIFTTSWNSLQIPYPVSTNITLIIYRANHPKIAYDAPGTTTISMHPALVPALHAYIAAKCFASVGSAPSASMSAYQMNMYVARVAQVKRENLIQSTEGDTNVKLTMKGFI